jgi:NAD(P)-dependent dehydrogenase (short-subunit alcohol dehydrogenase family)
MDTWFETGHVAIVTGASRGLGRALARELLARGIHTIVDARGSDELEGVAQELRPYGDLVAIPGDVTDSDHAHALIAAAREFGRLDLLVNNASSLGAVPLPRVDQLTHDAFREAFDTNVFAPIHLMQHALPLMLQNGSPATIVNVTSDAAVEAYPGWAGYGASKAALEHVSRVAAAELADAPVRILVVDPGDMNTRMHRDAIPDADPSELRDPADSARALMHAIARMQHSFERVRLAELALA